MQPTSTPLPLPARRAVRDGGPKQQALNRARARAPASRAAYLPARRASTSPRAGNARALHGLCGCCAAIADRAAKDRSRADRG